MQGTFVLSMTFALTFNKGEDDERVIHVDSVHNYDELSKAVADGQYAKDEPEPFLPDWVEEAFGSPDKYSLSLYAFSLGVMLDSSDHHEVFNPHLESLKHYLSNLTTDNVDRVVDAILDSNDGDPDTVFADAGLDVCVWEPLVGHVTIESLSDLIQDAFKD